MRHVKAKSALSIFTVFELSEKNCLKVYYMICCEGKIGFGFRRVIINFSATKLLGVIQEKINYIVCTKRVLQQQY